MRIYTVKSSDTLYSISKAFGVTLNSLVEDNQLEFPDRLVVGQALSIRGDGTRYTIRRGDTLYAISKRFRVSLDELRRFNPGVSDRIYPGQVIEIPVSSNPSAREIRVSAYCYPHIDAATLEYTLPELTNVNPFSYSIRADGSLTRLNDERVITAALRAGVAPIMVITNLDENDRFSTGLASSVLQSLAVQRLLLTNIAKIMCDKKYTGLDVDFEYVSARDRLAYNRFLELASSMLHPLGYTLSSAVPPKTSSNMTGLLYEGIDYEAHGRINDFVLLMTYDWGYRYGPPMAVSPYNEMARVLDYAVTVIPRNKILLGLPNYGYDWVLPHREGQAATLVSNTRAISIAVSRWANIQFDRTARTPYFNYRDDNGTEHVVWFDDVRSFEAKLSLIEQYGLLGMGYWNINTLFKQGWFAVSSMFNAMKTL